VCNKVEGGPGNGGGLETCIPAIQSEAKKFLNTLPLDYQWPYFSCPSSDFFVCQNYRFSPAYPPQPPALPQPQRPPPPPSPPPSPPSPPGSPSKPPMPPVRPPTPNPPPLFPGTNVIACTNDKKDKNCIRKASKNKCLRFKIFNDCKLSCGATCVAPLTG